jgi:hypothetical protein
MASGAAEGAPLEIVALAAPSYIGKGTGEAVPVDIGDKPK